MKKLYILTLFICLAGFGTSFAQTLKGHIYDANTNEPLVGAAVTYKLHGNQGTVSDINGAYEIKLPEGGVDLVFSYIGYEDVLMPIVIGKREVITKDVYMKESTKLLEEVVVSAGRFEQKQAISPVRHRRISLLLSARCPAWTLWTNSLPCVAAADGPTE